MDAKQLFQAGKLNEAVQALSYELRDNPSDAKRRTFLFELLCFAGEYDRADKQLEVLAQGGPSSAMGTLVYRAALNAERTRHELFKNKNYPEPGAVSGRVSGSINGKPFQSLSDADSRIGARLEVFAAGTYFWIPFSQLASVEMSPPQRLRDLLWSPAVVRTNPAFKGVELGELLLPVLSPFSWQHSDDSVRLGRTTVWEEADNDAGIASVPFGQKMLLVDHEEFPFLELRKLEFTAAQAASS